MNGSGTNKNKSGNQSKNSETDYKNYTKLYSANKIYIPLKLRLKARRISIILFIIVLSLLTVYFYFVTYKNKAGFKKIKEYNPSTLEEQLTNCEREVEFLKYLSYISAKEKINLDELSDTSISKLKGMIDKHRVDLDEISREELKKFIELILKDIEEKGKREK
ncbi:MAG: hypothetical protein AB1765_04965 [Candidatus Hydrogenedentota bacterium]